MMEKPTHKRKQPCIYCEGTGLRLFDVLEDTDDHARKNPYYIVYCDDCIKGYALWRLNPLNIPRDKGNNNLLTTTDRNYYLKLRQEFYDEPATKEICP